MNRRLMLVSLLGAVLLMGFISAQADEEWTADEEAAIPEDTDKAIVDSTPISEDTDDNPNGDLSSDTESDKGFDEDDAEEGEDSSKPKRTTMKFGRWGGKGFGRGEGFHKGDKFGFDWREKMKERCNKIDPRKIIQLLNETCKKLHELPMAKEIGTVEDGNELSNDTLRQFVKEFLMELANITGFSHHRKPWHTTGGPRRDGDDGESGEGGRGGHGKDCKHQKKGGSHGGDREGDQEGGSWRGKGKGSSSGSGEEGEDRGGRGQGGRGGRGGRGGKGGPGGRGHGGARHGWGEQGGRGKSSDSDSNDGGKGYGHKGGNGQDDKKGGRGWGKGGGRWGKGSGNEEVTGDSKEEQKGTMRGEKPSFPGYGGNKNGGFPGFGGGKWGGLGGNNAQVGGNMS